MPFPPVRRGFIEPAPKNARTTWYVDVTNGDDNYDGKSPDQAFATINQALGAASAGDTIITAAGTYPEAVDLNLEGLRFFPQLGTSISVEAGTPLTVSANYCQVQCPGGSLRCSPAGGGTGVVVSGDFCYVSDVRVPAGSSAAIGFDLTGDGIVLDNCRCAAPLSAAFKIQGDKCKLDDCCTGGESGDSSIGFWITNSCDKARLRNCGSQGHETAGVQIDAGVTNANIRHSDSGGGDGHYIDNGTRTYLGLNVSDSTEQHEHTYPRPDGEGTSGAPITVSSEVNDETGADTTADYWGDAFQLVAPAVITSGWFLKGVGIFANTINDEQRFSLYRVVYDTKTARNGGNDWDEGATVLTVTDSDDAAKFQADDLVLIRSPGYKPDGEIVKVASVAGANVTIERQTENSGRTGLHWDHTTNDGGSEEMYLVWRDEDQYHTTDFDFEAGFLDTYFRENFTQQRRFDSNDGLFARMINGTDGAESTCRLTVIWSDQGG